MLLAAEGFLTVQQELGAGMLIPSQFEEKTPNKKRKIEDEMEHTKGNSSTQGEKPQVLVARVEPIVDQTVLISTNQNGTSQLDPKPLEEILHKLTHTSQLLKNWIAHTPQFGARTEHKGKIVTNNGNIHLEPKSSALEKLGQTIAVPVTVTRPAL